METADPFAAESVARFLSLVDRRADNECWPWLGARYDTGYGQFYTSGITNSMRLAHRYAYQAFVGPIPDGLQIDHVVANGCTMRHCVNWVAHLEVVTCRENILRGSGLAAENARKTHCPEGHPYDEDNTYREPRERGRQCRTCNRLKMRAWREANPEKAKAQRREHMRRWRRKQGIPERQPRSGSTS